MKLLVIKSSHISYLSLLLHFHNWYNEQLITLEGDFCVWLMKDVTYGFLSFLVLLYIELSLFQIQYSFNPNHAEWLPAVYLIIYKLYQFPFKIAHPPLSFLLLSLNLTMCVILCFNLFPITWPYFFASCLSANATHPLSTNGFSTNIRKSLDSKNSSLINKFTTGTIL